MQNLCLLNKPLGVMLPNRFPRTWKHFCKTFQANGISVFNSPIDTWNSEEEHFNFGAMSVSPTILRRRYNEYVDRRGVSINSQVFCDTCADKRKTYGVLLTSHAITYLGSEYFSLGHETMYLAKPRRGQRKEGIRIAKGNQIMQMDDVLNKNRIIQEYKKTWFAGKATHDIRCIFFGEELIGSRIRWGTTIFDDRNNEEIVLPQDVQTRVNKQAKKLLKYTKTPHAIYSIDIGIEMKTGKPFVIECNSAVGFASLVKVDPEWKKLLGYVKSIVG